MEETGKDDQLLMAILQREGNVILFFEAIFGFLYRRTDFFRTQQSNAPQVGFPLGMAERILRTVFFQYYNKALNDQKMVEERMVEQTSGKISVSDSGAPLEVQTTDVSTANETSSVGLQVVASEVADVSKNIHTLKKDESCKAQKPEKPLEELTQNDFQNMAESYNGAIRDTYRWSQTVKDLDVRVMVPPDIVKSKMVKVDVGHHRLKIDVLEGEKWNTVVTGDLTYRVSLEESTWTLIPGECIHIYLEKVEERWWKSLLVGEPAIDIQRIDTSRPLQEFDDESRAKIEELIHQQDMKTDIPPSVQLETAEILKEAWNKEGSPFRGQPFDPKVISDHALGRLCLVNEADFAD